MCERAFPGLASPVIFRAILEKRWAAAAAAAEKGAKYNNFRDIDENIFKAKEEGTEKTIRIYY